MMGTTPPGAVTANVACFMSMVMWSLGFPAGEVLLEDWGAVTLLMIRFALAAATLVLFWVLVDGWQPALTSSWLRGIKVGGLGFGVGGLLLLIGQKLSDPVTPAIAAATMPVIGGVMEVMLDGRRLRVGLVTGLCLVLTGGYMATGVNIADGEFSLGAVLCLGAAVLYVWGTRGTTRQFPGLSPLGQTAITLSGAMMALLLAFGGAMLFGLDETQIGEVSTNSVGLLLLFSLVAVAFAQTLWIWGVGRLGVFLASFHVNALPFYVMVISALLLDLPWAWTQAGGAALVAMGVVVSQVRPPRQVV